MTDEDLARLMDELEGAATGYVTLVEIEQRAGCDVADAVRRGLLLVDERERYDPTTGATQPLRVCRLNRRHPAARAVSGWG